MRSEKPPATVLQPLTKAKLTTLPTPRLLSPSEVESLLKEMRESADEIRMLLRAT
ncbi:hypothetical protein HMY34_16575 [Thiothrix subterranea]|uniref:hypothetical protein n=1 Tax=Thiothrix subterranea TaxID=2735563 RepID=UPI00192AEFCF|nr:hypothetical protein [Thiothrix subterranea]QQZ30242.1 hypothetical protein HMY34_16575 [Thiothrix subterranea]